MNGDVDLETIGALLADKTRATIISTLLNGGLTAASVLTDVSDAVRPRVLITEAESVDAFVSEERPVLLDRGVIPGWLPSI